MEDNGLHYDEMVENALRGVVSQALNHVVEHGLQGDHHFYITFQTDFPGVQIPVRLKERYPEEITIVLQHQFWDLIVAEGHFEVTLSFDKKPEHLIVPLQAVSAFADPSVKFGLQFQVEEIEDLEATDGEVLRHAVEEAVADAPMEDEAESGDKPAPADGSAEVITLDAFRKKQG
jgi:hypothetical protein